ncbi:hypothetical protein D3C85_1634950 [compost metagenome]
MDRRNKDLFAVHEVIGQIRIRLAGGNAELLRLLDGLLDQKVVWAKVQGRAFAAVKPGLKH